MYEADRIFERFPDFIREFIYSHSWKSLRPVQIAAARTLFTTDHNLLLTSSTASGKTEAAFFPIITDIWERPPGSVGVLYIAPLRSLINDQFARIDELLTNTGIKVTHWHGDVAASHKRKLLENPTGILQITPESLESMLLNRSNDILRLFWDLRYVIIDEIHTLTGSDRGNQIICQLCRLDRIIGRTPRRIGLSATVGDPALAAAWLSAGTGVETDLPVFKPERLHWRLGIEHFYIQNPKEDRTADTKPAPGSRGPGDDTEAQDEPAGEHIAGLDAGYEFIYDCVKDRKSLVFSNSREETEYTCATLRQIARRRGEPDIFLIHHGFLSASIREEAELKMKDEETHAVTCATVTLELKVDIGRRADTAQRRAGLGVELSAAAGAFGPAGAAAGDDDGLPRGKPAAKHPAAPTYPLGTASGDCHYSTVYRGALHRAAPGPAASFLTALPADAEHPRRLGRAYTKTPCRPGPLAAPICRGQPGGLQNTDNFNA